MATLGQMLRHRAYFSPSLEAIVAGGQRYTYQQFDERVNQLAHYLLAANIKKGDRVGILCKNNHPFPTILLAAAKIGAIAVPLNWRLTPHELDYIIKDSKPKVIFYDEEYEQLLASSSEWYFVSTMIKVGRGVNTHPSFEALLLNRPMTEPLVSVAEEDETLIIYTSGTSGHPKGVVCTHKNLYATAIANGLALEFHYGARYMLPTPFFHISGLILACMLLYGMTIIPTSNFDPVELWDLIEAENVTYMMSVPHLLIYMLPELLKSDRNYHSFKSFVCGGTKLPETLIRQYDSFGFSIYQAYGQTEGTGAFCYWTPRMGIHKCHTVGKPVFPGEIKIFNPNTGQEVLAGEVGEIGYHGPQIFKGYWNKPEETQKVLRNGWLLTGDAGKLDEDGFLHVLDRYKDLIICGGENIYPAQVEEVIRQIDGVAEVALVGIPHKIWGELPRAYVIRKPDASISVEDILVKTQEKIAHYKLTEVVFVDQLPKNSFGKVLKRVLREEAIKEIELTTEQ
ncbi:class I adenylate-forming enzyme family protein [Hazenella coriacea]|uniref:Long-chain acyl-CoA synthetase n=1 Tax=Hazenella coriacea TaxID=1179467 RepID=A0A4R3L4G6_9BACL|nr:class I adenylate-forming enzyme family protein [Hazenella coriacea]TCS93620.1 long-chain acyl-CoA synthetase [Hazenella coriacea]